MGNSGVAYTFVNPEQGKYLTSIEIKIDRLLTQDKIEGFETVPSKEEEAAKTPFRAKKKRYRRAL